MTRQEVQNLIDYLKALCDRIEQRASRPGVDHAHLSGMAVAYNVCIYCLEESLNDPRNATTPTG